MISKFLLCVIVSCLALKLASSAEVCPANPAEIAPCRCVMDTMPDGRQLPEIQCVGSQVKDLRQILATVFLTSSTGTVRQFSALYINGTDITEVTAGTFGDAVFYSIFFGNNLLLRRIDPNAFHRAPPAQNSLYQIDLYNNPLLGSTSAVEVFELINHLQVKHSLDLSFLGITEIPDDAFVLNTELMHVYIQHNAKLARVGKYAFTFLPNLLNLIVQSNALSILDAHSLDFSSIHDDLEVDLSWNKLTQNSFHNLTFGTQGRAPYELILWANQLTSVPAAVFRAHIGVTHGIQKLILMDNPIVCDCHVKWIRDDDLAAVIPTINCADHSNRNLYLLDVHEAPATNC